MKLPLGRRGHGVAIIKVKLKPNTILKFTIPGVISLRMDHWQRELANGCMIVLKVALCNQLEYTERRGYYLPRLMPDYYPKYTYITGVYGSVRTTGLKIILAHERIVTHMLWLISWVKIDR